MKQESPMSYIEKDISIIPCRTTWDDVNKVFTGKMPAIREWSRYCNELPTIGEASEWGSISGVTGFGIVTGEASNIACIDIDTEDVNLIRAIKKIIPYTPCVIHGNKKRGGKFLYRLYDSIHEYKPPQTLKQKIKDGKKTICDIFYGNAYLLAPPSLHSRTNGGKEIRYKWEDEEKTLLKVGVHNLPILDDPYLIEKIEMAMRKISPSEMEKNLPAGAIDLSGVSVKEKRLEGHRHEDMVSFVNSMIAKRLDPTTVVNELIQRDRSRNGENLYFLDKTKGHKSNIPELNAMRFYMGNLDFANRGKGKDELEIPVLNYEKIHMPSTEWKSINNKKFNMNLPMFKYKWIANPHVRKLIQDASIANAVPPQNIFFYLLAGFSTVLGNKIKVQPYKNNLNYIETANLYVGIVASSGERKSETTSIGLRPLKKLNARIKEENKKIAINNNQKIKDIDVSIKKKIKDRNKEIEECGVDSELALELLNEINKLEDSKPVNKNVSLYEQNTTIQKLYEIAEENQDGIFVEFNEFGTKWKELQSKGNEAEKAFFLDGWDGRRQFLYKTKHNGENSIDELCLSVGFSAQFDIMEGIVADLVNNSGMNDGLLQRFLIFCSDVESSRANDVSYSYPYEIDEIFENAYYIEKSENPILLSDDAYELWMKFLDDNQAKKNNESNNAIISSISKYTGYVLRLALNLETIKNNGMKPASISEETFESAVEIVEYAEKHLRYIFSLQEQKSNENIISLFKTGMIEDETTVRDLYKHHQKTFGTTATEAMKVLEKLAMNGIIKVVKDGRANKIKINPALFTS